MNGETAIGEKEERTARGSGHTIIEQKWEKEKMRSHANAKWRREKVGLTEERESN